MDIMIALRN